MTQPIDLEQRNTRIVESWLDGRSYEDIASEWGIKKNTVYKIVRDSGYTKEDRRVTPKRKALHDKKPLSNLHRKVGNEIVFRRTTDLGMSPSDFARQVPISCQRLVEIEQGLTDPSLGELVKLCNHLDIPLDELTRDTTDQMIFGDS